MLTGDWDGDFEMPARKAINGKLSTIAVLTELASDATANSSQIEAQESSS